MNDVSVGEMVATSFMVSGSFSLVFWMLGLISGFVAIVAVVGLTVSSLLNHFLSPR